MSFFSTVSSNKINQITSSLADIMTNVKHSGLPYNAKADGVTDDSSAINNIILNSIGKTVYFPDGTYRITTSILLKNNVNVVFSEKATILVDFPNGTPTNTPAITANEELDYTIIKGGYINCQNKGTGIQITNLIGLRISGTKVLDCNDFGFRFGDYAHGAVAYELSTFGLRVDRTLGNPTFAGSWGIICEASDSRIIDTIVTGCDNGVKLNHGNIHVISCHVWTRESQGTMKIGYESDQGSCFFDHCIADSVITYGWNLNSSMNYINNSYLTTAKNNTYPSANNVVKGVNVLNGSVGNYIANTRFSSQDPINNMIQATFSGDLARVTWYNIYTNATDASTIKNRFRQYGFDLNRTSTSDPLQTSYTTSGLVERFDVGFNATEQEWTIYATDSTGTKKQAFIVQRNGQVGVSQSNEFVIGGSWQSAIKFNALGSTTWLWIENATGKVRVKQGSRPTADNDGVPLFTPSQSTANRPTTNLYTGMPFFDTTLGKPIWWNGSAWKDATGTTV
jgi:hypothetical protein